MLLCVSNFEGNILVSLYLLRMNFYEKFAEDVLVKQTIEWLSEYNALSRSNRNFYQHHEIAGWCSHAIHIPTKQQQQQKKNAIKYISEAKKKSTQTKMNECRKKLRVAAN